MDKEKLISVISGVIESLDNINWYGFTIAKNQDDKLQWFEIASENEMNSFIADGQWEEIITVRSEDVMIWNIIREYNENKFKNEDIDRYLKIVNVLDDGVDTYTSRDVKYVNNEDEFNKLCTELNNDDNQDEEEVYEKMFEDIWKGAGNYDIWQWSDGSCNYYRLEECIDMIINEIKYKSLDDYINDIE